MIRLAGVGVAMLTLAACSSSRLDQKASSSGKAESRGVSYMPDESRYLLYSEGPIVVIRLQPGADLSEFFDDFVALSPAAAGGATYRINRMSDGQIVRIIRVFGDNPVSIHFWVVTRTAIDGTRTVRLQPLAGWQPEFGGADAVQPLVASDAGLHLTAMRLDLPRIAARTQGP